MPDDAPNTRSHDGPAPTDVGAWPAPPTGRVDAPFERVGLVPDVTARPYGTSLFRRRIRLVADGGPASATSSALRRTVGELEDDFHHFRVELHHRAGVIERADGVYFRGPWSTCELAPEPLRAIEGQPVAASSTAIGAYAVARDNCTHLFDLAGLVVAHAARGGADRQYDLTATDPTGERAERDLVLWRDGEVVLHWQLAQREIVGPPAWASAPIRSGFIVWAHARFDADTTEAAIALRRIIDISGGRMGRLDSFERAEGTVSERMVGRCQTYSVRLLPKALRNKGTALNWHDHAELLLADMHLRG